MHSEGYLQPLKGNDLHPLALFNYICDRNAVESAIDSNVSPVPVRL